MIPRIEGDLLEMGRALLPPEHTLVLADPTDDAPELAAKVRESDAIVWVATAVGAKGGIPAAVWDAVPGHVKLIHTLSAGYDEIDLDRARAANVPVSTNGG